MEELSFAFWSSVVLLCATQLYESYAIKATTIAVFSPMIWITEPNSIGFIYLVLLFTTFCGINEVLAIVSYSLIVHSLFKSVHVLTVYLCLAGTFMIMKSMAQNGIDHAATIIQSAYRSRLNRKPQFFLDQKTQSSVIIQRWWRNRGFKRPFGMVTLTTLGYVKFVKNMIATMPHADRKYLTIYAVGQQTAEHVAQLGVRTRIIDCDDAVLHERQKPTQKEFNLYIKNHKLQMMKDAIKSFDIAVMLDADLVFNPQKRIIPWFLACLGDLDVVFAEDSISLQNTLFAPLLRHVERLTDRLTFNAIPTTLRAYSSKDACDKDILVNTGIVVARESALPLFENISNQDDQTDVNSLLRLQPLTFKFGLFPQAVVPHGKNLSNGASLLMDAKSPVFVVHPNWETRTYSKEEKMRHNNLWVI